MNRNAIYEAAKTWNYGDIADCARHDRDFNNALSGMVC
jgi:hypothetical protein